MQNKSFKGFSSSSSAIPVPDAFFTDVMPGITDINELKITMHVFWLIKHKKGFPRFVTLNELLADSRLVEKIDNQHGLNKQVLREALDEAVLRGTLLRTELNINGAAQEAIFLNIDPDRNAFNKIAGGSRMFPAGSGGETTMTSELKNIYVLYEQNIGMITPIVAEELKRAEEEYPAEWIEEAFKSAVEMNKRNWRYISRILEIWSTEGKDYGKTRGYTKKDKDAGKYVRGKYGHMVKR